MRQELSTSLSTRGITKIRAHEARAEHKPDFGKYSSQRAFKQMLKSMQP